MAEAAVSMPAEAPPRVLLVDDERNILSALRRALRGEGYRIRVAEGGPQALALLEQEPADLVVSDMRMPEMNGAEFLAEVARRWPRTIRILLTGYADLESTVAAINEGRIYQYLSKPWEDNHLRLTLRRALREQALEAERERLSRELAERNARLEELNRTLERRVEERTEEIRQTAAMVDAAYAELKQTFATAMQVFAGVVELAEGSCTGHGRRVAELAERIAQAMGLDEVERQDLYHAALLHDVGKIGMPEAVVRRPQSELTKAQLELLRTHPLRGESVLLPLPQLRDVARIIRSHHERFDGTGYPEGLLGEHIPLGARILAVADTYCALREGRLVPGEVSAAQAREFIAKNRFSRFDPQVVEAFLGLAVEEPPASPPPGERRLVLSAAELTEGMEVAEDLYGHNGLLLLRKGVRLSAGIIERLRAFERMEKRRFEIHVRAS